MVYTIMGAILGWLLHWSYTNYKKALEEEKKGDKNDGSTYKLSTNTRRSYRYSPIP